MKITTLALTTALLVSASGMTFAADPTDGKSDALAVEKMICQQLYVHQPAADVAFKPGVDVDGKAVAPADLPAEGASITAPDYVEVPLTVDLAQRLNQPVPDGVKLEGVIGNLRLYKDGRINYNGEDIMPQANALCGKELKTDDSADAAEVAPVPYKEPVPPIAGSVAPSATINPVIPKEAELELTKKTANFTTKKPAPAPVK